MNQDFFSKFSNRKAFHLQKKKEWKRKFYVLGAMRLSMVLAVVYGLYTILYSKQVYPMLYLVIFEVLVFVSLLWWTSEVKRHLNYHDNGQRFFKNELGLLSGKENLIFNSGAEAEKAGFSLDLDLLGEGSLFHRLNRTVTPAGQKSLLKRFSLEGVSEELILQRQSEISALAQKPEWLEAFLLEGMAEDLHSAGSLQVDLPKAEKPLNNFWKNFSFIWPVLGVAGVLQYLLFDQSQVFGLVFLGSWIVTGLFSKDLSACFYFLSEKVSLYYRYSRMMRLLHHLEGNAILASKIEGFSAGEKVLNQLRSISGIANQRMNALAYFIFNSIFVLDLQWYVRLRKWEEAHQATFNAQMKLLGEIDALVSLAWWQYLHPHFKPMEISNDVVVIKALGHPLLSEEVCVKNDWTLDKENRLVLITGSNMAGKSTFLRALGVNMVLGQLGTVVNATKFEMPCWQLLSSLRHDDSLHENTSYFYAELLKLKSVVEQAEKKPALILLDEILRGTNNDDKFEGAARIIERLRNHAGLTVLATHDTALCQRFHGRKDIVHFCFESQIAGGELSFDYKIRSGQAKNKNATFLMEKLGIV
ncbi:MutS-related protein [Persicobacter diffluens]|uniref:DNA mismatch repair protein MutS n=1 Tax=Persicobacter diffluens TaxID=981 RepID=A0AAN4VXI8_9BACT|nr:DNA mismatch repair protein MutS [Persicobacter diffluens]